MAAFLGLGCLVACGRVGFDARNDAALATIDATPDGPGAITFLFGDQTAENQGPDVHSCGSPEVSSYYATQSGSVDWIYVFHAQSVADSATAIIVGLYTDSGGNPNTLLAGGRIDPGLMTPNQWYGVPVPRVATSANTIYWIAVACPKGAGGGLAVQYKYLGAVGSGPCTPDATTPCTAHDGGPGNYTTMPATWIPGQTFFPSVNSFYAAYD